MDRVIPPTNTSESPYQKFGLALTDMLKKYQGMGTQKFQSAGYNAQTEQTNRVMAQSTPGMPPNLQQQVRNASVQAEQPNVSGAEGLRKSFSEQISGLGDAITQAQSIGQWMQEQEMNTKKEARDLVLKNTDAIKAMPDKERNELLKKAEISQSFLDAMPSQMSTQEQWKDETMNNIFGQRNTKTGEFKKIGDIKGGEVGGTDTSFFSQNDLSNIDSLVSNKSLADSVGGTWFGRQSIFNKAGQQDFIANVEKLISQLALDSLISAKSQGATFGALSNEELRMLGSAATNLGGKRILDKNGNVVGYSGSEESFKAEIKRMRDLIAKAQAGVSATTGSSGQTSSGLKYNIEP